MALLEDGLQVGPGVAGPSPPAVTGSVSLPLPVPSAAPMAWHQPEPRLKSPRVVLSKSRWLDARLASSQCSGSPGVKPVKIPVPLFTIAFPCESPGGPGAPGVSRVMFLCSRPWFVFPRSGNLNAGRGCAAGRCRVQLPIQ